MGISRRLQKIDKKPCKVGRRSVNSARIPWKMNKNRAVGFVRPKTRMTPSRMQITLPVPALTSIIASAALTISQTRFYIF